MASPRTRSDFKAAKYFTEKDIEEFRECFFYNVRKKGHITTTDELSRVIRSLGYSPTAIETSEYFTQHATDGKIDFANFLNIVKAHSDREKCSDEILEAFRLYDTKKTGVIPASDLRNILSMFGEKLSRQEVDTMFKEAKISPNGQVKYTEFLKMLFTPMPDY